MCDVDAEAVVAAVDAPSIYDIPKVLHAEGLDAYVVRRLGLPFRDVDWTRLGRPARPGAPPAQRGHGRAGRQVRRPARRLPVGDRGAARRRVRPPRAACTIRWVPSDDCETPAGAAAALAGVDAVVIPGGFGIRGIEGKLGAIRHARERGIPTLGPVPGPAVHGDRGGPQPGRPRGAPTPPSSTRTRPHPVIATMADQVDDRRRRRRPGRHDAPGRLPGRAARRARSWPRPTARPTVSERHRHRYEVNNAYRRPARGGRAGHLRHLAGRPAGRVRRAAARRAPVLRRHPGAPGAEVAPDPARTRCSAALIGAALDYSDEERLPVQIPMTTTRRRCRRCPRQRRPLQRR